MKRRIFPFLLALCLIGGLLPASALAAGDAFRVGASSAKSGDSLTVSFTQPTSLTVSTVSLTIAFDKDAFEITEIAQAPYANLQPDKDGCNSRGSVSIAYTDDTMDANTALAAGTVLLSLTFRVRDGASPGIKTFSVTDYAVGGAFDGGTFTIRSITPGKAQVGETTKSVAVTASSSGGPGGLEESGPAPGGAGGGSGQAAGNPFRDVAAGDWYYSAVIHCYTRNYFKGTAADAFSPKVTMTRAMFAVVLHRIAGEPKAAGGSSFTDVAAGQWYSDAIAWASGKGILEGYGGGLFGLNDPVTREQMAVIFWKYMGKPAADASALSGFSDAKNVSPWAKDAMAWAIGAGLLGGRGGGILDPGSGANRAEVAQIVLNYDANVK